MVYTIIHDSSISSEVDTGVSVTLDDTTATEDIAASTVIQTSMPDDSGEGMYASVYAEGLAIGDNTLVVGVVDASLTDDGTATLLDLGVDMAAIAASGTGGSTYAGVMIDPYLYGQTDIYVGTNVKTSTTYSSPEGSVATASSMVDVLALDIDLSGGGDTGDVALLPDMVGDAASDGTSTGADGTTTSDEASNTSDAGSSALNFDGNLALLDVQSTVVGTDTYLSVDAYLLAIDDSLSIVEMQLDLGVD